jgi:hypothetical protein
LHEFTSALEDHKPCGILLGSGGTADIIPELMQRLQPPDDDLVIYDDDPDRLIQRIIQVLDHKYEDIKLHLEQHDVEWYMRDPHNHKQVRAG